LTAPTGSPCDQQDALVALADGRDELLGDHLLAADHGVQFQQGVEVGIVGQQPRHARTAAAVQRLEHDVAVPGAEVVDRLVVAGDQGRRLHAREVGDEQLFRRVAHLGRIVHHQVCGWTFSRKCVAVM
jgi:hypothetical protein